MIAGIGLVADHRLPAKGWIGLYTPVLMAVYFVAMRVIFAHEWHRRAQETQEVAQELQSSHSISVVAIVIMNRLFLVGLTYKVMTKRFVVAWNTGAIAGVYVVAVALSYVLTR